jgi:hypothetical protein
MRALLLALVAVSGAACTENAALDLDVELPASTMVGSTPISAVTVQFAADTTDFMSSWEGDIPQTTVDLGATRQTLRLSVLARPEQLTRPLAVRVLYCESRAACEAAPADPRTEQHFVIQRAFYRGVVTRYRLDATSPPPTPPTSPMEIDRCEIAGCREGEMATWCTVGVHLCEQ